MSSHATAGEPMRVNRVTTNNQSDVSLATLSDGGWIVTYTSFNFDLSGDTIVQQRFDATGAYVGDETQVNQVGYSDQSYSTVTLLADGGWVVVYQIYRFGDGTSTDIYQRRFDSNGNVVSDEARVNSYVTDVQTMAKVTALNDGGWIVTWLSFYQPPDGVGYDIYQQRYNAGGGTVGDETRVNQYVPFSQDDPDVISLADGGWLVAWATPTGTPGTPVGIFMRRYDSSGATSGDDIKVNQATGGGQYGTSLSILSDGGWIVTWSSHQDGNDDGVYMQRYSQSGVAVGGETLVNTYTINKQSEGDVAGLADGGWIVVWSSIGQDAFKTGIYQQRYDADGNTVGDETMVNEHGTDNPTTPKVTALADGSWIVSWSAIGSTYGSTYDVYQRHFHADIDGTDVADTLTGTVGGEAIFGLAGNDTIRGGRGDDAIDGGAGSDVAVYSGNDTGYTYVRNTDGTWTVTAMGGGGEGTDTLTSIETLQFANKTVTLVTNTAPSALSLSAETVSETAAVGSTVGVLSATDAEGDPLTWTLSGSSRFSLVTEDGVTSLRVAQTLDYETTPSYVLTLTAGDGDLSTSKDFTVSVIDEIEQVRGTRGNNTLRGGNGIDSIHGLAGNDKLYGYDGDDQLYGASGKDSLTGSHGKDALWGGSGADKFVFALGDTGATNEDADTIYDFTAADRIDLSRIDARTGTDRNDSFEFLGTKAFTMHAGELRVEREASDTWIQGDTDGDGVSDFIIHLDDALRMKASHFHL